VRKLKIGNVYSSDYFYNSGIKLDPDGGFWHFKIIEIIYNLHGDPALYVGIKTNMGDYACGPNDLIQVFDCEGESINDGYGFFKLKRIMRKKQGIKIEQREKLDLWNNSQEIKKMDSQRCSADHMPMTKEQSKRTTDRINANPCKYT